ncbi:hypothetical protein DPMN_027189 [Dreissena polymorpha]|uniref:Uncharacterized protein n=1 Tax=Dreissena polymorpha TaxID=45954 RepID=A0A9D4LUR6_DREPO|nr:hypothetical protein DPMN_027189 [Dreissena polymorpha]
MGTIFELSPNIMETNLLTKFNDDLTNIRAFIRTNVLTQFNKDWTLNVPSREFTRFYYNHKKCPAPARHVFQRTGTILAISPDIIRINVLTKFHAGWTKNVTSRVQSWLYFSHIRKNATLPGGHIFRRTIFIFKLIQDIIITIVLKKFHEDWTINVTCIVLRRKSAQLLSGMFFNRSEPLSNSSKKSFFNEDWMINVTSIVSTRKNATSLGDHVFQPIGAIFELFHNDRINVPSGVLTKKNVKDARRTKGDQNIIMSTWCSSELNNSCDI